MQAGVGIALGGLLNIALDPLFMFALLPRGNEVLGAAIATCGGSAAAEGGAAAIASLAKQAYLPGDPGSP